MSGRSEVDPDPNPEAPRSEAVEHMRRGHRVVTHQWEMFEYDVHEADDGSIEIADPTDIGSYRETGETIGHWCKTCDQEVSA